MSRELRLDAVVDNNAGGAFWLGRSVMTTSDFREPAMLGRTGWLVTDQSESDGIVSPRKLVRFGWIAVVDDVGPVHWDDTIDIE